MRKYVRHPSTIPIELTVARAPCVERQHMKNIASGGFACAVSEPIAVGVTVQLRIPLIWPEYRGCGVVKWCSGDANEYEIGIEFCAQDLFKAKMVEQLSQIEHYRNQLWVEEGRIVDGEQAAVEWITRYAREFADAFQGGPDR
jgi:hypothetical protein